jgi:hypothetical protein
MGLRMQKNRKFTPDRRVSVTLEFLGTGADHHPVALLDLAPK